MTKEKAYPQKAFLMFQHGCARRKMDLDIISKYLLDNGWMISENAQGADIVILSTCAYDQLHEDEAVDFVKEYADKRKDSCTLVVAGCLGPINGQKLNGTQRIAMVPPKDLGKMDQVIKARIRIDQFSDLSLTENDLDYSSIWNNERPQHFMPNGYEPLEGNSTSSLPISMYDRRNKLIRISRGCMGQCSYGAIRFATGNLISKNLGEILKEVENAIKNGFRKITLVAEDIGCYGLDTHTNFVNLMREVLKCGDKFRVQLHSINPQWIKRNIREFGEC